MPLLCLLSDAGEDTVDCRVHTLPGSLRFIVQFTSALLLLQLGRLFAFLRLDIGEAAFV